MDEQAFLDDRRRALKESIAYFSGANKSAREQWVCISLLKALQIEFSKTEVRASPSDPPDVLFRTAQFEVKEIQEPDRRRHAEYKEALKTAITASRAEELIEHFEPRDITPAEIGFLVVDKLSELAVKYPDAVKGQNDLLLYVNLDDKYFKTGPVPSADRFAKFGWRSVSVFENEVAIVLQVGDDAPEFLRVYEGKVEKRFRS